MVLDVIEHPVKLMKSRPKIVLPHILGWIPHVLTGILVLYGLSSIKADNITEALSNLSLSGLMPYIAAFIPILLLSIIISVAMLGVYPSVVQQSFSRKSVSLSEAFSVSRRRFMPMLWSYIVVLAAAVASMGLLAVVALLFVAINLAVLAVIPVVAAIVLMFLIVVWTWQLNTVVALENLSGWEAFKRSRQLSKGRNWSILGILLILGFSVLIIDLAFASVPIAGAVLSMLVSLFIDTWSLSAPTTFYFLREKKMKPKN